MVDIFDIPLDSWSEDQGYRPVWERKSEVEANLLFDLQTLWAISSFSHVLLFVFMYLICRQLNSATPRRLPPTIRHSAHFGSNTTEQNK